ncbi:hypothetical protein L211DRAFT_843053 [Terfezia boudieri ATCC MYA-4762]|uniref:Uncharacterized protein n=1 Tax=Terfezia boudieri ATCC MYA-4762 TaxID=1051890 RepID=A0A3N4L8U8_9PEZI|nr:hypothetical protein L211DRAFT_843053 [Terfezia boudieri ATCC MYA-4762]
MLGYAATRGVLGASSTGRGGLPKCVLRMLGMHVLGMLAMLGMLLRVVVPVY